MDIAFYISELLKEHDEVGIPGAGTIYRKKIAAAFNQLTRKFDPPSFRLNFTSDENEEVKLIRYICKVKNISEPSAEFFTRKFGSELKQQLDTSGIAELAPLGKLRKSGSDYSVDQLIPADNTAYYGLHSVSELVVPPKPVQKTPPPAPPLEVPSYPFGNPNDSVQASQTIEYPAESIPEIISETEVYEKKEAVTSKEEASATLFDKIVLREKGSIWASEDEDPFDVPTRKIRLNKKWVMYSSLIIILASLSYGGYYFSKDIVDIYQTLTSTPNALPEKYIPILDKDTSALADSLAADSLLNSKSPDNISSPVDNVEVVKQAQPIEPTIVYQYELIGYSPLDKQDEDEFMKEMVGKGLKVRVIKDPKGNKISMGTYDSELAAMADIPKFKKLMGESTYLYPLPVKITLK